MDTDGKQKQETEQTKDAEKQDEPINTEDGKTSEHTPIDVDEQAENGNDDDVMIVGESSENVEIPKKNTGQSGEEPIEIEDDDANSKKPPKKEFTLKSSFYTPFSPSYDHYKLVLARNMQRRCLCFERVSDRDVLNNSHFLDAMRSAQAFNMFDERSKRAGQLDLVFNTIFEREKFKELLLPSTDFGLMEPERVRDVFINPRLLPEERMDNILVAYRLPTHEFKREKDIAKLKSIFTDSELIILGCNSEQPEYRHAYIAYGSHEDAVLALARAMSADVHFDGVKAVFAFISKKSSNKVIPDDFKFMSRLNKSTVEYYIANMKKAESETGEKQERLQMVEARLQMDNVYREWRKELEDLGLVHKLKEAKLVEQERQERQDSKLNKREESNLHKREDSKPHKREDSKPHTPGSERGDLPPYKKNRHSGREYYNSDRATGSRGHSYGHAEDRKSRADRGHKSFDNDNNGPDANTLMPSSFGTPRLAQQHQSNSPRDGRGRGGWGRGKSRGWKGSSNDHTGSSRYRDMSEDIDIDSRYQPNPRGGQEQIGNRSGWSRGSPKEKGFRGGYGNQQRHKNKPPNVEKDTYFTDRFKTGDEPADSSMWQDY